MTGRLDWMNQLITEVRRGQDREPPVRRRKGKVTATSAPTVTVQFASGSTVSGVHYLASYSPSTNDIVWMLEVGGDYLILGKQAT